VYVSALQILHFNLPRCWAGGFCLFYFLPRFCNLGNAVLLCLQTYHCIAISYNEIKLQPHSLREKALLFNLIVIYYSLDTENHSCSSNGESHTGETGMHRPNREGHFSRVITWH